MPQVKEGERVYEVRRAQSKLRRTGGAGARAYPHKKYMRILHAHIYTYTRSLTETDTDTYAWMCMYACPYPYPPNASTNRNEGLRKIPTARRKGEGIFHEPTRLIENGQQQRFTHS